MDGDEKPVKRAVEKSKEGWSRPKKSGSSDIAQKSSGVIRRRDWRNDPEAQEIGKRLAEAFQSMVAAYEATKGTREIRANHRSVTGWIAGQGEYDQVPFESTLERDFAHVALFEPRVTKLSAQPITLTWTEGGRGRRYTPDFLVEYVIPGVMTRRAIVEVKYSKDLRENRANLEPGFARMRDWCARQPNYDFVIATEKQVRTSRIENVRAIFPFRFNRHLVNSQVNDEVFDFFCKRAPISIGDVLEIAGDNVQRRAAMQAAIWGQLSGGYIWIDLDAPLGPRSVVHLTPPQSEPLFFMKNDADGERALQETGYCKAFGEYDQGPAPSGARAACNKKARRERSCPRSVLAGGGEFPGTQMATQCRSI